MQESKSTKPLFAPGQPLVNLLLIQVLLHVPRIWNSRSYRRSTQKAICQGEELNLINDKESFIMCDLSLQSSGQGIWLYQRLQSSLPQEGASSEQPAESRGAETGLQECAGGWRATSAGLP